MKRVVALLLALMLLPLFAFAESDEEDLDIEEVYDGILEEDVVLDAGEEDHAGSIELTEEMEKELYATLEEGSTNTTTINTDDIYINPNLPDNVINILLLGVDTREDDIGDDSANEKRADVQLILSINRDDGSIKLTSILRDTLVRNPSNPKVTIPITNAYRSFDENGKFHDNPTGSIAAVNYNFQMNIQYFFTINFYGVVRIIEKMGGIDVDLKEGEAWHINLYLSTKTNKDPEHKIYHGRAILKTYGKETGLPEPLKVQDGVQHLTGLQALIYARLRENHSNKASYNLNADWGRTVRTRHLLELLLRKVLQMDVMDIISLAGEAVENMYTNMNPEDMLSLIMDVLRSGIKSKLSTDSLFEQFRIPMDKTWSYSDGKVFMSWNNGNFQKNVEALHEFIYGAYYPAD